ncbi:putative tryptophanyl-tRNA synthetase [Saccharata proteae CBS 121410]|uniref:Tryptophan--tRNA ligase, cytoplasmic n=1 Tax=Saccharata proteae CBS 121410 TaxID=1314787 RepID=A0A9P4HNR9_9PEZI|nr:putative tryptophanyl-tRNA synthetase [Saccharata proteae CBS 121410]
MAEKPGGGLGEPPSVAALSIADKTPEDVKKAAAQNINPWDVSGAVDEQGNVLAFDYEAEVKKWNTKHIDAALLERFERVTGHKPHRWMRRGMFFSHRDFDLILNYHEQGRPFFLYTGRGPSAGSLHLGHTIPFMFTKWLQDVFDVPLVIMLTDDEKALFKDNLTFEEVRKYAMENAKDILAMGFDKQKTFIYNDLDFIPSNGKHMYMNAMEFSKLVTFNQVRGAFGFDGSTNIGRVFFPSLQCVAAFGTSYPHIWGDDPEGVRQKKTAQIPCLIPCAIDQDPYFRLVRENCGRMKPAVPKPALIHSKFLTALQGPGGKMSASDPNSAIYMSDTPKQIQKKVNSHAFSGGQETLELHRELGGNPDVDVAYEYLRYFEEDDALLKQYYDEYKKGDMLTGDMKKKCIAAVQVEVKTFQENRAKITDEVLKEYMTPRKLVWGGNPNPVKKEKEEKK